MNNKKKIKKKKIIFLLIRHFDKTKNKIMLNRTIPGVVFIMLLLAAGITLPGYKKGINSQLPTNEGNAIRIGAIPVVVVEEHHEVVKELFKYTNDMKNVILVHFDSHPDLAFPSLPDAVTNHVMNDKINWGTQLLHFVDIADWILPFILSKRINYIIWVAPTWSEQIPVGEHKMFIVSEMGRISIVPQKSNTNSEDQYAYWDSIRLLSSITSLTNNSTMIPFTLQVVRQLTSNSLPSDMTNREVVVDIDEDYFSCGNPLLEHAKTLINDSSIFELLRKSMTSPDAAAQEEIAAFISDIFTFGNNCTSDYGDALIRSGLVTSDAINNIQQWCSHRTAEGWDLTEVVSNLDIGLGLPSSVTPTAQLYNYVDRSIAAIKTVVGNPFLLLLSKSVGYTPYFQSPMLHTTLTSVLDIYFPQKLVPTSSLMIKSCILGHLSQQHPATYMRGIIKMWYLSTISVLWSNGTTSRVPQSVILTSSNNCNEIDDLIEE